MLFHPVPVTAGELAGLADKILFGSDLPSLGIPFADVVRATCAAWASLPEQEQAVFSGNADRLVPPR